MAAQQQKFSVPVSWIADPRYQSDKYRAMTGVEEAKLLKYMIFYKLNRDNSVVQLMTDNSIRAAKVFGRGLRDMGGLYNSLNDPVMRERLLKKGILKLIVYLN